jgi:RimJ/RimL family protein N-acetyltransferase
MTEIATTRLRLRRFVLADAADLHAIRGDKEAMRHWDHPGDADVEETREAARLFEREMAAGEAIYMTARLADGGFAGLFDLSELKSGRPDLGFMVVRRLWRQGYGREGAEAMVEEARRRGAKALKARIHAANEASRRLLVRLGFSQSSALRPLEVAPGRIVDCAHLEMDL